MIKWNLGTKDIKGKKLFHRTSSSITLTLCIWYVHPLATPNWHMVHTPPGNTQLCGVIYNMVACVKYIIPQRYQRECLSTEITRVMSECIENNGYLTVHFLLR